MSDKREVKAVRLSSEMLGKCPICSRQPVTLAVVEYAISEPNEVMCPDCLVGPPLSLWGTCTVCGYFQPQHECVQCGSPVE